MKDTHVWEASSIWEVSILDCVSGHLGRTNLPRRSRIYTYPGIRAKRWERVSEQDKPFKEQPWVSVQNQASKQLSEFNSQPRIQGQLVPAGISWESTGTSWVPAGYQLVPTDTSWYQLGTRWYQLVPAGTRWVAAGTSW